ncbi:MAG: hypothetical protein HY922_14135, partial [Elusimicrobia bacterium]|nr:hypothetical protein [Elusimicrobiota bacterium]
MKTIIRAILVLSVLSAAMQVLAQGAPGLINFQGRLTDSSNNPKTGAHEFAFQLWTASPDGDLLWYETQPNVPVANGIFSVQLGAVTPLPPGLFAGTTLYLQVTADGVVLSPRERLVSSPYAFGAELLHGHSADYFLSTASVAQQIAGAKTFTGALTIPGPTFLAGQAADPAGSAGAVYFNSATNKLRLHIGSGFVDVATGAVGGMQTVSAKGDQFSGDGAATPLALQSSSVTLQGNAVNSANGLLKLDPSGKLPALNGSLLTGIVDTTKVAKTGDTMSGDLNVGSGTNAVTVSTSGHITLGNIVQPAGARGRVFFDPFANGGYGAVRVSLDGVNFVSIATGSIGGGLTSINSDPNQFSGLGTQANPLSLKSSSVTLQGNLFNGAKQLLLLDAGGLVPLANLGGITSVQLAANAVDANKLAADAVTNAKILDGAVTGAKIAALAIDSSKLGANSVDKEKIVALTIDSSKLAANSVDAEKLVNNAVTGAKIAALAIDSSKLGANSVDKEKIVALTIDSSKLAANSVDTEKLVNNSVTGAK